MHTTKRLAATLAAAAALAAAAPAVASAATLPVPPTFGGGDPSTLCLEGIQDPGPLGPSGPYGADGPWGANGPLHGTANPLGDVASCGGGLTFFLRGGTIDSFVQANLQAVGH